MTEKRLESEGGGAKGLPNFEITHLFTNKQERYDSRVGFDAFAILELDPTDQLLTPDSVRLAMRMAIRHFFCWREGSGRKRENVPTLESGKRGLSSIVIAKRARGFEANMGQEMDDHAPDPSILTQRS